MLVVERLAADLHAQKGLARLYLDKRPDSALMQRAIAHEGLPDGWRASF